MGRKVYCAVSMIIWNKTKNLLMSRHLALIYLVAATGKGYITHTHTHTIRNPMHRFLVQCDGQSSYGPVLPLSLSKSVTSKVDNVVTDTRCPFSLHGASWVNNLSFWAEANIIYFINLFSLSLCSRVFHFLWPSCTVFLLVLRKLISFSVSQQSSVYLIVVSV